MIRTTDSISRLRREAHKKGYRLIKERGVGAYIIADLYSNVVATHGNAGEFLTLEEVVDFLNE